MSGAILYTVANAIATIQFNRPDKRNAFSEEMLHDLVKHLDTAITDPDVNVIVLTGDARAFSSGQELSVAARDDVDLGDLLMRLYQPVVMRLVECPKVTIAALSGPAAGAGASIAMACDLIVAAESAFIQLAFINIGLVLDAGATWFLPRSIGIKNVLAWALTGDKISAHDARTAGLIYQVYPDVDFARESEALAKRLAAKSPTACRLTKLALRASLANDLKSQFGVEERAQSEAGRTVEFRKAVETFFRK